MISMTEEDQYTILFFSDYGKRFGGAANTLLQQAVLMSRLGHKVVVFFSDYFGRQISYEYRKMCSYIGIEYDWETYKISTQPEDIDITCIDHNYERLRDKIKFYNPDIIHSVQLNVCVELISRELKIPHIMNIYPLIPAFFSLNYMEVFPHYHLCDSWYYARKWQYYLCTDSSCIRNVVNTKSEEKVCIDKREIGFLCVGAVYEEKNQLMVIKAFHRALGQGVDGKLTICGHLDGNYGDECIQYVEDNGLAGKVILNGFCADMDIKYLQNDVLLCGSTRESYPNAVSEALANGLIVISTPVGGVPEVIIDGENGYLARDYSENAFADKIIQVHKDIISGKIQTIIVNAKKTFMMNHSPQSVGIQLTRYYQYVLGDYKQNQMSKNQISINVLRNAFKQLLDIFGRNKNNFTNQDRVSEKLWYLYHIKDRISNICTENKDIYIWGAGDYGQTVLEIFQVFLPEIHIVGFLDEKKEGFFDGYRIYEPDEIIQRKNAVIVIASVNGQRLMIERLESYNKVFNREYFLLSKRRW